MLRLLAQREQGYDDIAALMGLSVEEVQAKVAGALSQIEDEGKPAPDVPPPEPEGPEIGGPKAESPESGDATPADPEPAAPRALPGRPALPKQPAAPPVPPLQPVPRSEPTPGEPKQPAAKAAPARPQPKATPVAARGRWLRGRRSDDHDSVGSWPLALDRRGRGDHRDRRHRDPRRQRWWR